MTAASTPQDQIHFAGSSPTAAMRERHRQLDWSATPLGPKDQWSPALAAAARICLDSPLPMCVFGGLDLVLIYNDAYRAILGPAKDAWALGRPARDVWAEIWPDIERFLMPVALEGLSSTGEDARYVVARGGKPAEDAWFTFALWPVRDGDGRIVGVLNTLVETTSRVRAEQTLRERESQQRFLLSLNDRLRRLGDTAAIQLEASTALGMHVGATRVGYAEILADRETSVVTVNYTNGVRGIEGRYRVADYSPSLLAALLDGRTVVRGDIANDPTLSADEKHAHADLQVGATVDVPLMKSDQLVAVLFMHFPDAHEFSAEELALLEVVAERTWEAVERARADAALRANEAQLRLAVDVAELGSWSFSLVDGSGFLDARAAQIVGLDPGHFANVARSQSQGTHPDDLAPMQAAVAAGIASGQPFDLSYRVIHADGTIHHVASRARVERDATGAPVRLVGTNRDVTNEHQSAERARLLQALTGAFSAALTPDAVVNVLLEHAVPAFGASTGVLLTLAPDGNGLVPLGSFGYGDRLADLLAYVTLDAPLPVSAAIRDRAAVFVDDRESGVARFSGLGRLYDVTGNSSTAALPLTDGAGNIVGALAFNFRAPRRFDDATRSLLDAVARQCAQALERARLFVAERDARRDAEAAYSEVEKANRAKAEFLAVMSHELRTPLNAIGGYAELIALGIHGPVTSEQVGALDRIQQSQRHLLGLINQVLNYARVDAGVVRYNLVDVPVGEALAAAEALVLPQVRARGLSFTLGRAAPTLLVRADREKLQQILLNVLSNAVKFTDSGGEVRVGCGATEQTVTIAVADTGVGIAPDKLASIFEPFVQIDQRHTRSHEGVGLGLAISRDLARGMSGDLVAESRQGQGSVFTLTLPRTPVA